MVPLSPTATTSVPLLLNAFSFWLVLEVAWFQLTVSVMAVEMGSEARDGAAVGWPAGWPASTTGTLFKTPVTTP